MVINCFYLLLCHILMKNIVTIAVIPHNIEMISGIKIVSKYI